MELTQDDSIVWEDRPQHDAEWVKKMETISGDSPGNSTSSDDVNTPRRAIPLSSDSPPPFHLGSVQRNLDQTYPMHPTIQAAAQSILPALGDTSQPGSKDPSKLPTQPISNRANNTTDFKRHKLGADDSFVTVRPSTNRPVSSRRRRMTFPSMASATIVKREDNADTPSSIFSSSSISIVDDKSVLSNERKSPQGDANDFEDLLQQISTPRIVMIKQELPEPHTAGSDSTSLTATTTGTKTLNSENMSVNQSPLAALYPRPHDSMMSTSVNDGHPRNIATPIPQTEASAIPMKLIKREPESSPPLNIPEYAAPEERQQQQQAYHQEHHQQQQQQSSALPPDQTHQQQNKEPLSLHDALRNLPPRINQPTQPAMIHPGIKRPRSSNQSFQSRHVDQTEPVITTMPPQQSAVEQKADEEEDEFGDFEFDDDDIAAMDNMVAATQCAAQSYHVTKQEDQNLSQDRHSRQQSPVLVTASSTAIPAHSPAQTTKDTSNIDASNNNNYIQRKPPPAETNESGDIDDEFGDFPDMDFDVVDQQIHTALTQRCQTPVPAQMTADQLPAQVRNRRRRRNRHMVDRSYPCFSRYKIVKVESSPHVFVKTLYLASWTDDMRQEEKSLKEMHRDVRVEVVDVDPTLQSPEDILPNNGGGNAAPCGCVFLRSEWFHTLIDIGDIVHICSLSGQFQTDKDALPIILDSHPAEGSDVDDLVLITHPDLLMTATTISDTLGSSGCSRRAVIKSRLGSSGLSSTAALLGTMRHDFFAQCLQRQDVSFDAAQEIAFAVVRENAENLIGCGMSDQEATNGVLGTLHHIRNFAEQFTEFGRPGRSSNQYSVIEGHAHQPSIKMLANSIVSIEEPVVSTELGLKGIMDAILDTNIVPASGQQRIDNLVMGAKHERHKLMALELKTGHNQAAQNSHTAQLSLYTLMLQARHGVSDDDPAQRDHNETKAETGSSGGCLLYLNHKGFNPVHVMPRLDEVKSLLSQRNVVATHIHRAARPRGVRLSYEAEDGEEGVERRITVSPVQLRQLPEVLATPHTCSRCYANRECMLYTAAEIQSGNVDNSNRGVQHTHAEIFQKFVGHLSEKDVEYFRRWDRLIDLETSATSSRPATSWLVDSQQREKETSECMSNMSFEGAIPSNPARSQYKMVFRRRPLQSNGAKDASLSKGSLVIISTDTTIFQIDQPTGGGDPTQAGAPPRRNIFRHLMFIVRGTVDKTEGGKVFVRASKDDLERIRSMMARYKRSREAANLTGGVALEGPNYLPFRLDKDNVSSGLGTLKQNLVNLLTADTVDGDDSLIRKNRLVWLRDVVVNLKPPQFKSDATADMFNVDPSTPVLPGCDLESLAFEFADLNQDQVAAVRKVISAEDYTLIQGFPGTGKTSTLSFIARLLAARGMRVLITSYTHNAVDNVALKLLNDGLGCVDNSTSLPPLVRVGRKSSVHESVRKVLASELAAGFESNFQDDSDAERNPPSASSLHKVISAAKIVCCSALSVPRSGLLSGQHFDIVIVDEAGQISQPAILGALMSADSFVLVGDHLQLPPLVISEIAEQLGYGESLMSTLAKHSSDSIAPLTLQYRMADEICKLSSEAVYDGSLRCGTSEVANRQLHLPNFPSALSIGLPADSLHWLHGIVDPNRRVVFVDTDQIAMQASDTVEFTALEGTAGGNSRGSVTNETENVLVRNIVHGLITCGLNPSSIGVMSPFRVQLHLLEGHATMKGWAKEGLEFSTIDRYQGRDKDAIIMSLVRSNPRGRAGRLLQDVRRLNVALTRAKSKLVMVGSFSTLTKGSDPLGQILNRVNERGQRIALHPSVMNSLA